MQKKDLEQLCHLNREIELLKRQIESISPDIVSDSVKGSSAGFPYTQHTILISGMEGLARYDKKLTRLKKQLKRKLDEIMDVVDELNEQISLVSDSEMRQILTLRYINNLTWQQVAYHIGEGDESYPRRKCGKFLKLAENAEK